MDALIDLSSNHADIASGAKPKDEDKSNGIKKSTLAIVRVSVSKCLLLASWMREVVTMIWMRGSCSIHSHLCEYCFVTMAHRWLLAFGVAPTFSAVEMWTLTTTDVTKKKHAISFL